MSYLKQKSTFNIDSAKELIELNYYAPSVHCSYYGSFQFMKYTLKNYNKTTYEEIEQECLKAPNGTHGYIIGNTLAILKSKIKDNREFAKIKRVIKDLKTFRIKSDYFNEQILSDEATKSLEFSELIIRTVKTNVK